MRDMVFVSHANPEDNEFTLWLALQLASAGYPVWCDLTKLLGGEDFWKDIEKAIRERTVKFVYVLSQTSNVKDGALKELAVAESVARREHLHDFIIPAHIDDLPHADINIQLFRLNVIGFKRGWAQGLAALLQKLEDDGVEKKPNFNPDAVTAWWRTNRGVDQGVVQKAEEYPSNWFPIAALPPNIYYHKLRRTQTRVPCLAGTLAFPAIDFADGVMSFAPAQDYVAAEDGGVLVELSRHWRTSDFLDQRFEIPLVPRQERRKLVQQLLRVAWKHSAGTRGLPTHEMANKATCVYFTDDVVPNGKSFFTGISGKRTFRGLVGDKNFRRDGEITSTRHWHFGVELKPMVYPDIAFVAKARVLFSSDGHTMWNDSAKAHVARRNQCKHWWNADWRDRILASMAHLADDDGMIRMPVAAEIAIEVAASPLTFTSPVTLQVDDLTLDDAMPVADEDLVEDEQEEEDSEE